MGFQFQSVAPLAPFLAPELELDNAQLGWLIGLYMLPGIAIALPGGLLGARYGDKRVTLVGLALMTLGGIALAAAPGYATAQAARVASGAGAVILNVLLTKMVADWFDGRDRVLAMSILINSWPIGIGLALAVLGPLGEHTTWRAAIAIAAALAVVGFITIAMTYRPPVGATAATVSGIGVLDAREWRLLAIASIPWLVYNAAYQLIVSFLPAVLIEQGSSIARSGAMTAVNTLLIIASVQAGGLLLKRARHPDLICHAAIFGWAASILLLASTGTPWLWIVAGGLIAGLPASAFVNLPAEFLRPQSRGAGMGVFYTVFYLGCAVLPAAAGRLADVAGSPRATLWFAAALALICVPTLALSHRAMRA
jgi:MFS family permease